MSPTVVTVSGADPGGWIGWLARTPLPPFRKAHLKKINTRKNKRKYVGPKKIEIRTIAMHANAEPLTEV